VDYGRKKEKHIPKELKREDTGEITVYACVKRNSLLFLSFSAGKWTQETCGRMIEKAAGRMASGRVQFYSDGNDDYTYVLPLYFSNLDYGQLVKKREKGRVVDKEKRTIHGFTGHEAPGYNEHRRIQQHTPREDREISEKNQVLCQKAQNAQQLPGNIPVLLEHD